ncbi:MAG: LuxR C-terminal-related transcriptional regulator [Synergistaceae bacterium]|nr:LuxR C-terminal-related transcriptional regulator [Synergistaceae bacterium]
MDNKVNRKESTARDRRLSVVVFALFFSWLLAFPFEGQVMYAITEYHGVSAHSLLFGAMAAHFAGLIACGFFVKNMRTAKRLILFSIAFCAAATGVFFLPYSFLWTAALFPAAFLVGACVAAWGFYFKGCTQKGDRIKTMADCLIFSNVLMILLNISAIHVSPQIGLGFSILELVAAFLFALLLPNEETLKAPAESVSAEEAISADKFGSLVFLCLFIVVITINSGLMYQVVNPAFNHLKLLTSWYWAVPYITALFIMRNLPRKTNRAYSLYVAIAMIGFSFIAFLALGRSWVDYLAINTLLLGAYGVYDLFWWSILGEMLEYYKNPSRIIGIGLSANVLGVLLGGIIGNAVAADSGQTQSQTLLALWVVLVTLIMLPPLHNRLTKLLKNHIYLTALLEMPAQEQSKRISELDLIERLTEREHEVMLRIVNGRTNREIADELVIVERTVKYHVGNIFAKTGVTSRTELTNLVLRRQ